MRSLAGRLERHGAREGFTFLEMMLVLVILGLLITLAAPRLDSLTPKYRLRSGARQLASDIENHRLAAMTRGIWLGVLYTMDGDDTYYQLIPPAPRDYPNQPIEDREPFARTTFPRGVMIQGIRLRGSDDYYDSGTLLVRFSPTGISGSHAITLVGERGMTWAVTLNCITGTVDFKRNEEGGFDDYED